MQELKSLIFQIKISKHESDLMGVIYIFHEYSISNFANVVLLRCATLKLCILDSPGLTYMEMFVSVLIPQGYVSSLITIHARKSS